MLVVLLGVDLGLLGGVIFSLVTVVIRSQNPHYSLMGQVPDTEIYRDVKEVSRLEENKQIQCIHPRKPSK